MSQEPWARRVAVLRSIMREGGTIYRSQLAPDYEAHVPWLLDNGCLRKNGERLTITATGREVAGGSERRP